MYHVNEVLNGPLALEIRAQSDSDYTVDNAVAVLAILPPAVIPEAHHDRYENEEGKTIIVTDHDKGLLANDINKANQEFLSHNQGQVMLVDGPVNGTLTLNSDGTFSYTAGESGGIDTFSYKIVVLLN